MDPQNPPHIPSDLLEWLEEVFPDECPSAGAGPEEMYRKQGEQRVLKKLRHHRELQREDALEA